MFYIVVTHVDIVFCSV